MKKKLKQRPTFRNLRLLLLLFRFILLSLCLRAYRGFMLIGSRVKKLRKERKELKMKARIIDQDSQGIPPMPTGEKAEVPESSSPSTISESSETQAPAVSEALAGDLIALPFEVWHLIQPPVDPLSEFEKTQLAGPFSRILEKYGLGKIAKDEIVLGFYLTAIVYGRIKAVREAKKQEKIMQGEEKKE
jgi:hypothetical protein